MYKIKFFNYGHQIYPATAVFYGTGYDQWVRVELYMFLIQGQGLNILIDAGMSKIHAEQINPMIISNLGEKGAFVIDRDPIPTMQALWGLDPGQIDAVIVTHFHLDHVCNLPLFTQSKFYVSRCGFTNIIAPIYPEMVPSGIFPREAFTYLIGEANDRLIFVDDQATIFPGIELLYTGGHTLDHQIIKLQTNAGNLLFPADNLPFFQNLERHLPCGNPANLVQAYSALKMAEQGDHRVIVPHDPKLLEMYPGGEIQR